MPTSGYGNNAIWVPLERAQFSVSFSVNAGGKINGTCNISDFTVCSGIGGYPDWEQSYSDNGLLPFDPREKNH
jgi:hypothetical protein